MESARSRKKVKDPVIQNDYSDSDETVPVTYIFQGQKLHAFSHLVGEAEEIFVGECLRVVIIFLLKWIYK